MTALGHRLLLAGALVAIGLAPAAAAPRVMTDIAPVHSVVARVMRGVGEPGLLVRPGVSEHNYALRPSEAGALQDADLVVWIGPELTPWLEGPLDALAEGAQILTLSEADGVVRLPVREGGPFEAHVHEHEGTDDHDDAAEHEHEEAEDHDYADAEDHDEHGAPAFDPHLWLDPANAAAFAAAAAEALAGLDAANAEAYRANAAAFAGEIDALIATTQDQLAPARGKPYVVFHDAYLYFETRFDLPAAGSIALSDAAAPSAARLAELRDRITTEQVACVFAEPQHDQRLVATVIAEGPARSDVLDPIGADLPPGPGFYTALIAALADGLVACLAD